jgi:acyl carrier protein
MVTVCKPGQGYRTQSEGSNSIVGCGRSTSDQSIRIVDPTTLALVKEGEIGEIWIQGPSVAKGYWGQDDLSNVTFNNFLNGNKEGPYLRTGDLGLLNHGELFITGRLKDLIIIRGLNYYPQDIERTVEACHPTLGLGSGAAFSIPVDGEEQLVLIQELTNKANQESANLNFFELNATIRETVATHHNLEVFAIALLVPSSIPKTASNKISRHFCKLAFQENSLKTVHLWKKQIKEPSLNPSRRAFDPQIKEQLLKMALEDRKKMIDTKIRSRISQILEVEPSSLEINQTLSTLGLDSLMFLQLKNELETSLGISLPIKSLFKPGFGLLDLSNLIAGQLR